MYIQTKYRELLCDIEAVKDNAGLMAIKYFTQMGAKKIYLAGFDGYSHDRKGKLRRIHNGVCYKNGSP